MERQSDGARTVMDVSSSTAEVAGDDRARTFEVLIRPLLREAYGLAFSMLGDRGAAEDAVQEAAIKAWRAIGRLRSDASPRPWFLAIVANQCRDLRRARRFPVIQLNDPADPVESDHADRVARDLDLERALALLSPEQSALLFLRYRLDMPPSQIAVALRWRVGTVKSRLHRTLRKLEAELTASPMERTR